MKTKISFLFALLFCAAAISNAQINDGQYLLGGGFGIGTSKGTQSSHDTKNESFNVNIQFGKAIEKNTVVGIFASYGYYSNSYSYVNTPYKNLYNQYTAGIFYRKYKPLTKNFYFFGEVNGTYFHSKGDQVYDQLNNTRQITISNGASVYFIPGISYAICKRMQVELTMPNILGANYSHTKTNYTPVSTSNPTDYKQNSFSLNASFNANLLSNFGIGFKFILGK